MTALPLIEIVPADGGFDHPAKYLAKTTQEICPDASHRDQRANDGAGAQPSHRALSCRGYSRSDFIVSGNELIYLFETNTLPGLTRASLYPKALKAVGIESA